MSTQELAALTAENDALKAEVERRLGAFIAERDALKAEVARLRRDCSELYQVIGTMAEHCPDPEAPQIIKALDNASDAAAGDPRRHDDLLPFVLPKPARDAALARVEKLEKALREIDGIDRRTYKDHMSYGAVARAALAEQEKENADG